MDEFVAEVDEAIRDGKVPPTSKTPELIQTTTQRHNDIQNTLENAAPFLTHLETQKEILCHVRNR